VSRFKVVIAGGGIAAVEGLLKLRAIVGDAIDVTVLCPSDEFRYRPQSVDEPFSRGRARRLAVRRVAQRTGAEWVEDSLERLDPDAQAAHTLGGAALPYDALLLAVGGRLEAPFEHVTVFDDREADETFRGLVQDVEAGYTRSVALVIPEGAAWPLPAYELALMTAERAWSMGEEGLYVALVTPEPAPLAALGDAVSEAVAGLLEARRVTVHTGARPAVPASRRLSIGPSGPELEPERIIAMPRIVGRPIRNVPASGNGFVPIDDHCRVKGLGERVFAAGDAADFPIKHGGLGAQQADVAATMIAALAGADVEPVPLRPVVRGVLHTGGAPLYLSARLKAGRVVESHATEDPGDHVPDKVDAQELSRFLKSLPD
jgi:sulfide:quinone oxidoreductase